MRGAGTNESTHDRFFKQSGEGEKRRIEIQINYRVVKFKENSESSSTPTARIIRKKIATSTSTTRIICK